MITKMLLNKITPPKVDDMKTIVCEGSILAAFAFCLHTGIDDEHMLRLAAAVPVATAVQLKTDYIEIDDVRRLEKEVYI